MTVKSMWLRVASARYTGAKYCIGWLTSTANRILRGRVLRSIGGLLRAFRALTSAAAMPDPAVQEGSDYHSDSSYRSQGKGPATAGNATRHVNGYSHQHRQSLSARLRIPQAKQCPISSRIVIGEKIDLSGTSTALVESD